MSEDKSWAEQEAIDKWFIEHGLDTFPHSAMMELKKAVTAPRIEVQGRIADLERKLDEAREVIKPFADAEECCCPSGTDDFLVAYDDFLKLKESTLNLGNLRRAAQWMKDNQSEKLDE